MEYTFAECPSCFAVNRIRTDKAAIANCGKCQKSIPLQGLVSEVSINSFDKILRISDKPVIVDFWASWCGPCKMYGPEFQKASTKNPQAVFLKVNTETEQMLSSRLGIRGIPCTIIFKNGQEVKRQAGAMEESMISSLLQEVKTYTLRS
jgi:thioredoxin 2